jgi:hypothetical protein
MKQALRALEDYRKHTAGVMIPQTRCQGDEAITALRQAIEQAESQQQIAEDFIKYGASWSKRGKRIDPSEIYAPAQTPVHASDISQERVDETAKDRHEPESNDVEIAAEQSDNYAAFIAGVRFARVNLTAPSKEWVGLTDGEMVDLLKNYEGRLWTDIFPAIEARLKEKNTCTYVN